tara:strand:+ start:1273 stop:1854 length:582 start_codon:yes stop_codon:yes gene_type:complete
MINYIKKKLEVYKVSRRILRQKKILGDTHNSTYTLIMMLYRASFNIIRSMPIYLSIPLIIKVIRLALVETFLESYIVRVLIGFKPEQYIKLKYIHSRYSQYSTIKELKEAMGEEIDVKTYNWNRLKESIKKYKNIQPLSVCYSSYDCGCTKNQNNKALLGQHQLLDGNHRYMVLKELYGENYKVKVKFQSDCK